MSGEGEISKEEILSHVKSVYRWLRDGLDHITSDQDREQAEYLAGKLDAEIAMIDAAEIKAPAQSLPQGSRTMFVVKHHLGVTLTADNVSGKCREGEADHAWSEDGERCLSCGSKRWSNSESGKEPHFKKYILEAMKTKQLEDRVDELEKERDELRSLLGELCTLAHNRRDLKGQRVRDLVDKARETIGENEAETGK